MVAEAGWRSSRCPVENACFLHQNSMLNGRSLALLGRQWRGCLSSELRLECLGRITSRSSDSSSLPTPPARARCGQTGCGCTSLPPGASRTGEIAELDPSWTQGYIAACRTREIPMDRTAHEGRLIAVLRQVQGGRGPEYPPPTRVVNPLENLPEFDGNVRPVAPAIHAKSIRESQTPRSIRPVRTADIGVALQPRHPRDQVRHPARRQNDDARAVGARMQAPQPLLGRAADTAVARGQLERARLPADQHSLTLHWKCAHVAVSRVVVPWLGTAPFSARVHRSQTTKEIGGTRQCKKGQQS